MSAEEYLLEKRWFSAKVKTYRFVVKGAFPGPVGSDVFSTIVESVRAWREVNIILPPHALFEGDFSLAHLDVRKLISVEECWIHYLRMNTIRTGLIFLHLDIRLEASLYDLKALRRELRWYTWERQR